MCPHKFSLNIKFKVSSWAIDFRSARKSHDQPLCAYLMRHDAHLQSHSRSWTKWYIYRKNWNPMKTIQVIIRTPSTHERAPRFIKKSVKNSEKNTHIKIQKNPGTYIIIQSLWLLGLKSLAGKLTSGIPKMPKSHDQPLCAYIMKYDAHIQSHPRSSPMWYIYQKN